MGLSLDGLPEEVLYSILCYCHPTSSVALEQTAHRFRNVTNEPLLWRFYCQVHFKYWDNRHDILKKLACPAPSVDWKALYISRHLIDSATSHLLDSIIASQAGRIQKFQAIVNLGYDIKDTLLRHSSVGLETDDYLARRFVISADESSPEPLLTVGRNRYYAQTLLSYLHRSIAIAEWARLRNGEYVPLERALGVFDLFIPEREHGSLGEISMRLGEVYARFITDSPDICQFTPREKALAVASYLRESNLTGIEPGREYHFLEHNFLGVALDDPGHNSLPLVSAAIYCYVAQRLGLNARPCGFPLHVHVVIMPPPGYDIDGNALDAAEQGEPMYMDPFRSGQETHPSTLRNQLVLLGASNIEQSNFLGGSQTTGIVLRCARNILTSIQRMPQSNTHSAPVDSAGPKYAALWSLMLFSDPMQTAELRHYLPWLMELFATDFPSDVSLIEQYLAPLFRDMPEYEHILESLHAMRVVDEIPKQMCRRATENRNVKYRIGQVFEHRRYNYKAIITGWDTQCGAEEHWMRRMGIDRLQAGRHQSFYHVLVEDKTIRYVAEENIQLITCHLSELPRKLIAVAGRHFKRWDTQAQSFVSNMKDEYPDD